MQDSFYGYYYYKTGITEFSGHNSADAVRPLLRVEHFHQRGAEQDILQAIFHQGDRSRIHGPYEEIVKDAYLLQLYFQNTSSISQEDTPRLRNVLHELGIPGISGKDRGRSA